MQSFIQRNRILLLHLSFWCAYFSFVFYQFSSRHGEEVPMSDALPDASIQVFFVAAAAYLNYFFFLPRFLKSRNLGRYFLEFLPPFALLMAALILLKQYQVDGFTHQICFLYSMRFMVYVVLSTFLIVVFVGMLKFAEQWFELERRKREIENEQLNTELRFLKAQINPHFLFNTLNNLYALAFDQSPNTTAVIAQLSQMMRYMIYDSNHPRVPLEKEIEYMENYISLEKLRLSEETQVEFSVEGNARGLQIAPFILITFLENAFKHGVTCTPKNTWIKAKLKLPVRTGQPGGEGKQAIFEVENSKPGTSNEDKKPGIGLQIVQRRLELSYPENYNLEIRDEADKFSVKLKVNLI